METRYITLTNTSDRNPDVKGSDRLLTISETADGQVRLLITAVACGLNSNDGLITLSDAVVPMATFKLYEQMIIDGAKGCVP